MLFWDANGRMFADEELTQPTPYRLVELEGDDLGSIVLGTVEDD